MRLRLAASAFQPKAFKTPEFAFADATLFFCTIYRSETKLPVDAIIFLASAAV